MQAEADKRRFLVSFLYICFYLFKIQIGENYYPKWTIPLYFKFLNLNVFNFLDEFHCLVLFGSKEFPFYLNNFKVSYDNVILIN